uniref:2-(3-amino-3-carboxypropyl)histidine synthase subunit 2 n=1 Tax=Romanomermis culicivorax TaxID=13658 RepID=A0A915J9Y0_ROMCU
MPLWLRACISGPQGQIIQDFDDNRPITDPAISAAGYGSFHQQYLIDDKIVAVGVIDILNFCISSKYFFYDPKFSFLNLGVYSALREAALVRKLNNFAPDIKYYYLGFYLHDNPKMKYKGRYAPSYLLCPETFTWQPIEQCLPLLDAKKFCRLNQDLSKIDTDGDVNVNKILVQYGRSVMQFKAYKAKRKYKNDTEDEQQAKEYGMTNVHVQFSSQDKIIDNEPAIHRKDNFHIDEPNFDCYFENQETADWISANGFKRVALQFPDELLYASSQVSFALEKRLGFKPYILADTSYGSCCVDDVAAQHVKADCIIHYGDACMSKTERGCVPVKYIFPKSTFSEEDLIEKLATFKKDLLENRSLALILDISYLYAQEILTSNVKKIIPGAHRTTDFDADFAGQPEISSDCILFIGRSDSKRALLLSLMNPDKNFYVYDPEKLLEIYMQDYQTNKMLRKRLYMIEKAKDAQIIGIVVATVNVSDYLKVLERMKFLCKNASKKYYVLFVGKLNVAKLSNFADIDLFVLLSCPFGVMFDCSDYLRPIITPFEFEIACNSQKFWMSGVGWRPEPASVFKDNDSDNINNCVPETDFSLTGGHLRTTNNTSDLPGSSSIMTRSDAYQVQTVTAEHRFRDRSWKGLEEKLGETPTALVKQGRKGIASAYEDEKEQSSPE